MVEELDTWERQEQETDAAWYAFSLYRDLPYGETGEPRTKLGAYRQWLLNRAAREGREEDGHGDPKTVPSAWNEWETKNNWRDRVLDYDRYMDGLRTAHRRKQILEAEERHARAARMVFSKAVERILNMKSKDLTASEAITYLREAARLERQALGEPTEIIGSLDVQPIRDVEVVHDNDVEDEDDELDVE